jgi:hypothetical protein
MRSVVLKIISKVSYFFSAYSLAIQVKALEREKKEDFVATFTITCTLFLLYIGWGKK